MNKCNKTGGKNDKLKQDTQKTDMETDIGNTRSKRGSYEIRNAKNKELREISESCVLPEFYKCAK